MLKKDSFLKFFIMTGLPFAITMVILNYITNDSFVWWKSLIIFVFSFVLYGSFAGWRRWKKTKKEKRTK